MTTRRLALLGSAALAFVVASCAASSGAPGPASSALERVGVLPAQAPLTLPDDVPSTDGGTAGAPFAEGGDTRTEVLDTRVFLEGDSVLRGLGIGSPDPLDLYVASLGWTLTLDAEDGRFTDEGVAKVLSRKNEVHDVLVTMLGNNYGGDPAAYEADLVELLMGFPDVKLFVMFTVPEYRAEQREVNDVLHRLAALDRRILLVDWDLLTRTYDALSGDGIHPTVGGRDVLAQALGLALGKAPGAGPDVTLPALGSTVRPVGVATNKGENTVAPSTAPSGTRSETTVATATTAKATTTTTKAGASTTTAPGATTTTKAAATTTTTKAGATTTSTTAATSTTGGSTTTATASTQPTSTEAPTTAAATTAPSTAPPGT
jgi:hypothetical protein